MSSAVSWDAGRLGGPHPVRSVVVAIEHSVFRAGLRALCGSTGVDTTEVDRTATLEEIQALGADLIVLDPSSYGSSRDPHVGVELVQRLTSTNMRKPVLWPIVHDPSSPVLRLRLLEAGAQFVMSWSSLATSEALSKQLAAGVPEAELLTMPLVPESLGIRRTTRINRLVRLIDDHDLHDMLDPIVAIRAQSHSRRAVARARSLFGGYRGLEPVNESGLSPQGLTDNGERLPGLPQLRRFYAWAYLNGGKSEYENDLLRRLRDSPLVPVDRYGAGVTFPR